MIDTETSRNYDSEVSRNIEITQKDIEKDLQKERKVRENLNRKCED